MINSAVQQILPGLSLTVRAQSDRCRAIRDIVQAQHALACVGRNAQHRENLFAAWNQILRSVRMKGALGAAHAEQFHKTREHLGAQRTGILQIALQLGARNFLAIDPARDAGGLRAGAVPARTEERVKVDARHARQRQHDRLRRDKARDLGCS